MIDYCHKWLGLGEGIAVHALSNTEDATIFENVRINSRRGLSEVAPADAHAGHAVLIGGGPSLEWSLPEIERRQQDGQTLFALNGTAKFLLDHGIMADYTVILDPRAENARFVEIPVTLGHLLASQCHPAVFERADAQKTWLWHFATPGIDEHLPQQSPSPPLMGGGLTVGLTAMALVFAMGYRKIHLYGYDSSDRDGEAHAYPQAEAAPEKKRVEVWCGSRKFISGIAMYAQAEAFPRWANMLAEAGAVITVHGDGLLPTVARHMNSATLLGEAA